MAVMVLLVCSTLAAALVSRNVVVANQSVQGAHRAEALGAAELGVAHAEAAVGAGAADSFRAEGSSGAASWSIVATEETDGSFTVRSTGIAGGQGRTVEARIQRRADGVRRDGWHEVAATP
jgi:hypothetical protein